MPRNASGVYSLPEVPFVAGTTIESDPMNNDLSDIADALTDSLATTGVTSMTGPVKAASGSVTAPSYTFAASQGTGFWLSDSDEISWSAGGVLMGVFGATGVVSFVALALSGDLLVTGSAGFAADVGITGDLGVIGQIFVGDGSASNPSYSFLNSDGAGLYLSATNQLGIAVASVNVATIRASGSVNIVKNVSIEGNQEIYGTLIVLGSVSIGSTVGTLLAIIEDQKTQNTSPQTLSSGSDQIRELTTEVYDRNSVVTLSSNQFTLPAGSYFIRWWSPVFSINFNGTALSQSFLYNATDATVVGRGTQTGLNTDSIAINSESVGSSVVTIADSKAFEIRHRVSTSTSGGVAANFGTEVYTRVEIYYN